MHFSHLKDGSGSKLTKIAVVAVFHVILAVLLIKSMNIKMISIPKLQEVILTLTPETPAPPPPPVEPPKPMPAVAPPEIFTPPVEVAVPQQPVAPTIQTSSVPDPAPAPTAPAAVAAAPSADSSAMRTAMLADGNSCAKPEYPARAARMGETGTVTLALLVGVDGRVTGSRVQKSSGSKELDRAAVTALSLCKFKPATNGGVPEPSWGQIAYIWNLDQ
ncbi:MAG: energy transducer TonB [Pseudomonadota bacterium]